MLSRALEDVARGHRIWDVCIVGSGPAGLTLAHALGTRGWSVLVLEAGSDQVEPEQQSDLQGEVVSDLPLNAQWSRLRCLGGSSNHWGGFCQALDASDFQPRVQGLPTAWPIGARDLQPWQAAAEEILEIGPPESEVAYGEQLRIVRMRYSPPVQFGRKYRDWLERSPQVLTLLGACLTELHESGGRIDGLTVSDPHGRTQRLRARQVVLCAGGIENSRLLLWAHERSGGRIVREPRALGRYWCEHPHFTLGEAWLSEHAPFEFDAWNIAWLMPTAAAQRSAGMLNTGLRLTRRPPDATMQTVRRFACVAPELGRWALRQTGRRLVCGVLLRAAWEQTPRPWNRIVLSKDRDRYGVPRPEIHWRLDDQDRHTVRTAATLLGAELARRGHGRVRLDPWLLQDSGWPTNDETVGNHHMGGTRMARDPRDGVVDEHCRVHGLANLHVAGSSVFAGVGAANPTLTIVQLALRLADRLNRTQA